MAEEEPEYDVAVNVHKGADGYGIYFNSSGGIIKVTKLDADSEAVRAGVQKGDEVRDPLPFFRTPPRLSRAPRLRCAAAAWFARAALGPPPASQLVSVTDLDGKVPAEAPGQRVKVTPENYHAHSLSFCGWSCGGMDLRSPSHSPQPIRTGDARELPACAGPRAHDEVLPPRVQIARIRMTPETRERATRRSLASSSSLRSSIHGCAPRGSGETRSALTVDLLHERWHAPAPATRGATTRALGTNGAPRSRFCMYVSVRGMR